MSYSISDNGYGENELHEWLEKEFDQDTANTIMLAVDSYVKYPPMTRETIAGDEETIAWITFPALLKPETGALDFDKIEKMLATGEIAHPLSMKKAPIVSIVSTKSGFSVSGADERLAEFMGANLFDALPRAIDEILTYLEYGAYFGEVTWEPIYPQEYELTKSPVPFWGISGFHGCHPTTISEILRTEDERRFRGFVQRIENKDITVGLDRALVISNEGLFGNLSGKSVLEPVYLWWFWYELIWRAFLRFLQRCGVGVVAVSAPPRAKVKIKGVWKDSMDWALEMASSLHRTNYAAIPSDVDPDSKAPLWKIEYLKVGEREGEQFVKALELLATNIRQHLLTGTAREEETGEFQIMLDTERVLANIAKHLNRYVLRKASMWNSSKSRRLEVGFQGANTTVLPLLFKLMAVAGNTAGSALRNVDWRQLFTRGGVPILDEDEVEKLKKEEERSNQNFNDPFSRTRSQYREIQRAKGQPGGEGRWASQRDKEGQSEKMEQIWELLSDAMDMEVVPISEAQKEELSRLGLLSDNTTITLFNPYHDTVGRFTDKAHATKPLPEGLYHSHGLTGPIADFRIKDATSLAYEKMGQKPVEVHTYGNIVSFAKEACKYSGIASCAANVRSTYAVVVDDKIHVSPLGARRIKEERRFGEYVILHEARHTRKRSDGSRAADLTYEKGNKDSLHMAHARKVLEEGTVDLLTRRDIGVNHKYWRRGVSRGPYLPYMGAIAIIVAAASGWNRARAWQLIDQINYRINDNESIWEILEEVLGSPSSGWNGKGFYALLKKLQARASLTMYRELGWLFGGDNE